MLWRFFQRFSSGLLRAFAAAGDARRLPCGVITTSIQPRPRPIIAYLTT
jgi:hypothetical protein